jgi:peroxiredoxin
MRLKRLLAVSAALSFGLLAQGPPGAPPSSTLKVGDKAPDFTLPSTDGKPVHLADLIGKSTIVLAFFPAAFTGG